MRTLKLTLQYDGTAYGGWQRQANAPSIQGLLEAALARIEGSPVTIHGAGRTDAGVHALGQVASCRLAHSIPAASLQRALNVTLPHDVRVVEVLDAADDFHARFLARGKLYRYRIVCGRVASPFERRYAWHLQRRLDWEAVERGARRLEGRHDFGAFQASSGRARSTVRTITRVSLRVVPRDAWLAPTDDAELREIDVEGTGFLRHMVRTIAGTLVEIGDGRRTAESLDDLLEAGDRTQAGPTAPAHGLFLVRVDY